MTTTSFGRYGARIPGFEQYARFGKLHLVKERAAYLPIERLVSNNMRIKHSSV